jgi:hypothetical protein
MNSNPYLPQPSSTSSSQAQPDNSNDLTWLDFIRTAGGAAPAEHPSISRTSTSSSQDRKRRHAGSSPERRYPYPNFNPGNFTGRRPSGMSLSNSMAGNSRDAPIDLTSPPRHYEHRRPSMPSRTSGSADSMRAVRSGIRGANPGWSTRGPPIPSRRESDFVLPRWQPDSEVNKCPVCGEAFHFFFRKHHCRKCGRVVCSQCSPHRITIPRQYIVQPPTGSDEEEVAPLSPNGGGSLAGRNLGGGEVVRVCNPCVPDPWTPDTAPNASDPRSPSRTEDSGRRRSEQTQPDRYRSILPPIPTSNDGSGRARAHTYQPASAIMARNLAHPQGVNPQHIIRAGPPPVARSNYHRYSQSSGSNMPLPAVPPHSSGRPPLPPAPSAPPQPRQRREVREEDECPVCGTELPPGDAFREAHIQECIASRFSSGTPSSLPAQMPHPASPANDPEGTGSRPRATSYRPRGMAVYRATEKDCLDESGEVQECVICFEEFQPGDEMGRMECWCKFHRACIRQWWETKGGGSCPTHQLHE